ncbi:hypothetical protein EUA93_04390 [Nocardioides oleivorans]|uniref:DUF218 domain-containing protein n=1 Tax=Nocardioides oleivorans TaxID=273676 RepID=A0A4Q2RWS5_9ACTN|nr:ElyC/SanA/YdcF family protein [Nocardioides oleivorans]RYB93660.1 hypothetical protein EUA93_04390 [Nocardioides oleivorans]
MQGFDASTILAIGLGLALVPVLTIPYVAWSYRHGVTGLGHAAICVAGAVYAMTLWTFTIVPLPTRSELSCTSPPTPQLVPFASLTYVDWSAGAALLTDPMLVQIVRNIVLFVPLGMLLRHLFGWRTRTIGLVGLGTSLLIETTQLTGNWWIYPCAYRLADVDDLISNTSGALVGVLLAPLLARIPGQEVSDARRAVAVRPRRRLVGMLVDWLSVQIASTTLVVVIFVVAAQLGHDLDPATDAITAACTAGSAIVLLLVVPLVGGSGTLGQRLAFLRTVRPDATRPRAGQWLVRFLTGAGGYFVADALARAFSVPGVMPLARAWLVVSALAVLLLSTRGISGYASGLVVVDSRSRVRPQVVRVADVDPRRLSSAVLALAGATYVVGAGLVALSALAPRVGVAAVVLAVVVLVLTTLVATGHVLRAGILLARREGFRPANALGLAAVAGVVTLLVSLVLAVVTGWGWLAALTAAGLAATGYLGFLFTAFLVFGQLYARRDPDAGMDAVVVLGSRVFGDRVPPLLRSRIDRALEVVAAERAAGRDPVLVMSGGQGADETVPEAVAMASYAVSVGADADRLLTETGSRTTQENLLMTRELLREQGLGTELVVATNDFHAFRAAIIARELDVDAQVVGSATASYYFPSAVLREFVAVLSRSPRTHATVLGLLVVTAAGLGWLLGR